MNYVNRYETDEEDAKNAADDCEPAPVQKPTFIGEHTVKPASLRQDLDRVVAMVLELVELIKSHSIARSRSRRMLEKLGLFDRLD